MESCCTFGAYYYLGVAAFHKPIKVQLTEEQVNSLAPDAASIKAATKVFLKTTWNIAKSDRAIWAPIKGSGAKPYFVQMDILDLAFKCSCPSRKFPCKHGLAIGLYIAHHSIDSIPLAEKEPLWVEEWVKKRANKTSTKAAKPKKKQAPEIVQKKNDDKWKKAVKSIEFVDLWLKDVIKLGILEFPNKDEAYWADLTKRMVDAKTPGINTYFNYLAEIDYQGEWQEPVLRTLSNLHLLTQAILRHERLDPAVKKELELLIGWNINKNDLLTNPKTEVVSDVWLIIKIDQSTTDNLESRKVHLYGVQSNRHAYILEFAFGSTYFKDQYIQGGRIQAKMAFYPGLHKTRAFVKIKGNQTDVKLELAPLSNLEATNLAFKKQLQEFSWTFELPQFVAQVNVIAREEKYFLMDSNDSLLPISGMDFDQYLLVLSQTQGHLFDAFIIRSLAGARLIGLMVNEKLMTA